MGLPLLWKYVDGVAYAFRRIVVWLDPQHDPTGIGWQINQAMIAVGSGGIWGRGFGHSMQKFGYLPEPHNDFILAMIGEEWGFVGVLSIIPDRYGQYEIPDLKPRDYHLIATTTVADPDAPIDTFFASLVPRASRLTIAKGETILRDLMLR